MVPHPFDAPPRDEQDQQGSAAASAIPQSLRSTDRIVPIQPVGRGTASWATATDAVDPIPKTPRAASPSRQRPLTSALCLPGNPSAFPCLRSLALPILHVLQDERAAVVQGLRLERLLLRQCLASGSTGSSWPACLPSSHQSASAGSPPRGRPTKPTRGRERPVDTEYEVASALLLWRHRRVVLFGAACDPATGTLSAGGPGVHRRTSSSGGMLPRTFGSAQICSLVEVSGLLWALRAMATPLEPDNEPPGGLPGEIR